jgi:DNA-binding NtrC family response regulator
VHVTKQAMEALVRAPWPGNFRELESFIERCVIVTQGDNLESRVLSSSGRYLERLPPRPR